MMCRGSNGRENGEVCEVDLGANASESAMEAAVEAKQKKGRFSWLESGRHCCFRSLSLSMAMAVTVTFN